MKVLLREDCNLEVDIPNRIITKHFYGRRKASVSLFIVQIYNRNVQRDVWSMNLQDISKIYFLNTFFDEY